MKILKKMPLLFLITFASSLLTSSLVEANPNYATCGPKPGLIDRMLHDAEKIRLKCIDDAYESSQQAARLEVAQLYEISKKLDIEIKKSAIRVSNNNVQCVPRPGERSRDPKLVARCQELLKAQNGITTRTNNLMGWSNRPKPKAADSNASIAATPPCPTKEQLDKMRPVRMFNRKLFVTYERCVTLNPESHF